MVAEAEVEVVEGAGLAAEVLEGAGLVVEVLEGAASAVVRDSPG
jgi:hypothetical protein